MSIPILLLGSDGDSTRIIYHHLSRIFGSIPAVIEQPMSRKIMLKVRVRKLGLAKVVSQLAFMALVTPILKRLYRQRIAELKTAYSLDCSPITTKMISHVNSINSRQTIKIISSMKPKVIIVNGTRIISKKVLNSTDAMFINTHAGITPKYRGCHGGYWALLNADPEHCGVTVHLVDPGIDTGNIIGQDLIHPTKRDAFVTYPYLQTVAAFPILEDAVKSALNGSLDTHQTEGQSSVWYHPGLFQYLIGLLRGIR